MKILVLSDSHSALRFMRLYMDSIRPDAVIHLGDYVGDGEAIAQENPGIVFYQVAGNCDQHRVAPDYPEVQMEILDGCRVFFTHGHLHKVKVYLGELLTDARRYCAQAVLFGHTHAALCRQEEDGMWILNPGSCGHCGGSAGLIETSPGKILSCRILREADLESGL